MRWFRTRHDPSISTSVRRRPNEASRKVRELEALESRLLLSRAIASYVSVEILPDRIRKAAALSAGSLPAAASDLAATALSTTSIQLSWTDNSANETGFEVLRQAGGRFKPLAMLDANATSFTDTGLKPNHKYTYEVVALDGTNGIASNRAMTKTEPLPTAPSQVRADAVSWDSVQLNWLEKSPGVTGYQVLERLKSSSAWTVVASVAANVTSYLATDLLANTSYVYAVQALNGDASSKPSRNALTTTGLLDASPLSATSVQLSWANPGNGTTGFQIERKGSSDAGWTVVTTIGSSETAAFAMTPADSGLVYSYNDAGLSADTQYTYQVVPLKGRRKTKASNAVSVTTFPVPNAPTNLNASPASSTSIQLSWSDNSSNETGYQIEREVGTSGVWTLIATVGANVTSYTDPSAVSGTLYGYQVFAMNGSTLSAGSNTATASPPPSTPSDLSMESVSPTSLQLSWADGAGDQTGFKIARSTDGVHFTTIATVGPQATSYTDSGLTASTNYYYIVIAVNAGGESPTSMLTATTLAAAAPNAPDLTTTSVFSADRIDLSWTDSSNNEQDFVVQESTDGTNFTTITTLAANTTSFSVTGLQPATQYFFRVRAENNAGTAPSAVLGSQTKQNVTVDGDGWTTIVPSADSRIIYVSSSTGNDNNSGLSPSSPVKTIAKGESLMRNGYPDWLLLKRGDTFTTNAAIGTFSMVLSIGLSGRSATEPMVVGAYGTGSRPTLDAVIGGRALNIGGGANNLAIIGLNITSSQRDPSSPNFASNTATTEGVLFLAGTSGTTGFLMEDCSISYCSDDINLQGFQGVMNDVTIRRNIVTNSYSAGGGHSQGLFISNVHNLLLEDNIFDHNGWNAQVAGADPTIFNHNVYVQYDCSGSIVVRDNISANASSHGMQIRPGGVVENNLLVDDPNGILWGNTSNHQDIAGYVKNNVILGGNDINRSSPGTGPAWAITVDNTTNTQASTVVIDGNIIANIATTYASSQYLYLMNTNGVTFTDNMIYNWPGLTRSNDVNTTIANNTINGTGYLAPTRSLSSYNVTLGGAANDAAFLIAAESRASGTWNSNYDALTVINYIRAGFNLPPTSPS